MAVQRVVNAHPVDREETLLAEAPVTEHLLAQMAHLDVEHPVLQLARQGCEHQSE